MAARSEVRQAHGLEKLIPFGPLLFAIPMAIFGGDHLVTAEFVATLVPKWIPWHLFWAYFVGVALIAAALSLVTKIQWRLAALLLGIMIFLFVLMIHIPGCFATPFDKTGVTLALRDLALSASALALAAWQTERGARTSDWLQGLRSQTFSPKLIAVTRFLIAIPIAVFGVDQILNPTFAPGIPQDNAELLITMPAWIPAHAVSGWRNIRRLCSWHDQREVCAFGCNGAGIDRACGGPVCLHSADGVQAVGHSERP